MVLIEGFHLQNEIRDIVNGVQDMSQKVINRGLS